MSDPEPSGPPAEARAGDDAPDDAEVRAALHLALREELEGDRGAALRWFVYAIVALVVLGFVAMFVYAWRV